MKQGLLLLSLIAGASTEGLADDCVLSIHGAHYFTDSIAEAKITAAKINQQVKSAAEAGSQGNKVYGGIAPTCVTRDGVKYLFNHAAVLQNDYQKYVTYDCWGTAVLSNDGSAVFRIEKSPVCYLNSKDIRQD